MHTDIALLHAARGVATHRGETADLLFILRWSRDSAPDYGWRMAPAMPPYDEMLAAFVDRDRSYDGAFVAAVRTTGIFCRSSCPARRPHSHHVEFFETAGTALAAGYRPCLRCRPLETNGAAPAWLDRNLIGASPGAAGDAMLLAVAPVETPLGVMLLGAAEGKLCLAEYSDQGRLEAQLRRVRQRLDATLVPGREAPIADAEAQLVEYFAGLRRRFDLPLLPAGTDLQRQVWETLLQIPYGETWTYGQVAAAIDRPRAARPVGQAVGANPISIIVPCHRVIGASGTLTGYGGGLWRKQRLLALERE